MFVDIFNISFEFRIPISVRALFELINIPQGTSVAYIFSFFYMLISDILYFCENILFLPFILVWIRFTVKIRILFNTNILTFTNILSDIFLIKLVFV